ncbi:MAG: hypothetical protein H6559_24740 [Lewinellaceae bacterium]|nr:hypothetical protein [Lewinellaceae bacterium]
MPLLGIEICGHKCKCRRRCDGWFGLAPALADSCRRLCNSGRTEFTKEEYLCDEINEVDVMRHYGYDPCPGRGLTLMGYTDPTGEIPRSQEQAAMQAEQLDNAMILGAVLIIIALMVFMSA